MNVEHVEVSVLAHITEELQAIDVNKKIVVPKSIKYKYLLPCGEKKIPFHKDDDDPSKTQWISDDPVPSLDHSIFVSQICNKFATTSCGSFTLTKKDGEYCDDLVDVVGDLYGSGIKLNNDTACINDSICELEAAYKRACITNVDRDIMHYMDKLSTVYSCFAKREAFATFVCYLSASDPEADLLDDPVYQYHQQQLWRYITMMHVVERTVSLADRITMLVQEAIRFHYFDGEPMLPKIAMPSFDELAKIDSDALHSVEKCIKLMLHKNK